MASHRQTPEAEGGREVSVTDREEPGMAAARALVRQREKGSSQGLASAPLTSSFSRNDCEEAKVLTKNYITLCPFHLVINVYFKK